MRIILLPAGLPRRRSRLTSNVRPRNLPQAMTPSDWPAIDYFHENTARARARLSQLEEVAHSDWHVLYRRMTDGSLWRLEREDRLQQRFLVRVEEQATWKDLDSSAMEKDLLLTTRGGVSRDKCVVAGCQERALLLSAFCLEHTYERGVRK